MSNTLWLAQRQYQASFGPTPHMTSWQWFVLDSKAYFRHGVKFLIRGR